MKKVHRQSGFSLMELMVAMVILLVILGAVFALMRGSISAANTNYEMTTAQQELRNSQERISRDVLLVGDGLFGLTNIWLPTQFVTDYLTVRTAAVVDPSNRGYVSIGSVLSDFDVPAGTAVPGSSPATTVRPNSDRMTTLAQDHSFSPISVTDVEVSYSSGYIRVPAARIADFQVGEVYFLANSVAGVFGTVTSVDAGSRRVYMQNGDSLGLNRTGITGNLASVERALLPMNLIRVQIVQFYVDANDRLIRRVIGIKGGSMIDSVVAEHLINLKFEYTLRPSSPTTILDQPVTQVDLADSTRIRMIETALSVETAYALQDGVKRQVDGMTRLGVRNVQFLEAPVPRDSEGNTVLPNPGPTPNVTPTPTPTPPPTPTPIPTPTPTPTPTPSPTPT
ncbi:MAG: prepilin-type N-terminal cleavage/methylation domain-containing protein, partial [Rhodothermales bacterium]|nr:prepilin-type N-terminal cleavage/methylation domain-containing protein [Rhodothermales bacterium]